MAQGAKAARGRPRTAVPVNSREEMGVLLWRRRRFLADYARKWLPAEATGETVEAIVDRAGERLLAIADPHFVDGEDHVRRVIREECARSLRAPDAEAPADVVDPVLGGLVGPVLDALKKVSDRQQRAIWKFARDGLSYAEIAEQEGVATGTIRARLHYGRHKALEHLRKPGHAAPALLLLAPRRLRSLLAHVVERSAPQYFATTALVPLVALFANPQSVAVLAPPSVAIQGTALTTTPGASAVPAMPTVSSPISGQQSTLAAFAAATNQPRPSPQPRGAAAETPDDVTLRAIASPADGRPVLVAIGVGNTCMCSVLMQSTDGGATWSATDGPPADVSQLVLPPAYPRGDPRIFAGVDPTLGSGPYMAAAFGQPFVRLPHLPPGQVAVSAHFDDGDPRLFTAGQTAVWSMAIGISEATLPHDEVDYSAAAASTGVVAALATPSPSPGGPAMLVWAPAFATTPGSATALSTTSTVFRCSAATSCAAGGNLPVPPWRLAARGTNTAVAYNHAAAYVSHDDGVSFAPLPLPEGTADLVSVTPVGAGALWMSFARADGSTDVARLLPAGWIDAASDSARARTHTGLLVAVGADTIIEEFSSLGYRCTTANGGLWTPRCPAS